MRIPIEIPDAVLADIVNESNARDLSPEAVVISKLQIGMSVPAGHRYVLVEGTELRELEDRLGLGQIASGEDLRKKVERLARIEFGVHEIRLTPAELEELKWRSAKTGKSLDEMIALAWEEIKKGLFTYAVGAAARSVV